MGHFKHLYFLLAIGTSAALFSGALGFFYTSHQEVAVGLEDSDFSLIEVTENLFKKPEELPPIQKEPAAPETPPEVMPTPTEIAPTEDPVIEAPEIVVPTEEPVQTLAGKDTEEAYTKTQEALVNILCVASGSSPVGSISGSGIIIDPSGMVLTNAHIAQHFLLKDYPSEDSISCTIRTGSPAKPAYTAELAYISPRWIVENSAAIAQNNPTGTGKDDFALLTITGATEFSSLPQEFPFLPVVTKELAPGDAVVTAGYPASFLESEAIQRNLVQIAAVGEIQDIFTFTDTTVDLLSLGGVPLAQQGASGGAVVRPNATLAGLVVTSSLEGDTQERDLRAITTAHIARSFREQHGTGFLSYVSGYTDEAFIEFSTNVAPALRSLLLTALGEN